MSARRNCATRRPVEEAPTPFGDTSSQRTKLLEHLIANKILYPTADRQTVRTVGPRIRWSRVQLRLNRESRDPSSLRVPWDEDLGNFSGIAMVVRRSETSLFFRAMISTVL